jgi:hypothetical protein
MEVIVLPGRSTETAVLKFGSLVPRYICIAAITDFAHGLWKAKVFKFIDIWSNARDAPGRSSRATSARYLCVAKSPSLTFCHPGPT